MNIDTIKDDMDIWSDAKENHIHEVKSKVGNREAVDKNDLIPEHIKNRDADNDIMISSLNEMLQRVHTEPSHHNLIVPIEKPEYGEDGKEGPPPKIINNTENVRDLQKQ